MLIHSTRNVAFLRQKYRQGLSISMIHDRIRERLVWDGPYPDRADIIDVIVRLDNGQHQHQGAADTEAVRSLPSESGS